MMDERALPSSARRSKRGFAALMSMFVAAIVFSTGYTIYRLRAEAIVHQHSLSAAQARAVESHLTQTLQLIDQALDNVVDASADLSSGDLPQRLAAALRLSPALRSLSVLDADDRVVASTNADNIGKRVVTADYLPPAVAGLDLPRFGRPWRGRDLADGALLDEQMALDGSVPGFLPLLHEQGQNKRRLLATLNPDFFLSHYVADADLAQGFVEVFCYNGQPLLSTRVVALPANASQRFPWHLLPSREFGDFAARLEDGAEAVASFRASSRFPLVVIAYQRREAALAAWAADSRRLVIIVAPTLLVVVVLASVLYARSRRLEEEEAKARQSEQERLAGTVFGAVDSGVAVTDAEHRIVTVNQAFSTLSGYALAQVAGTVPRQLFVTTGKEAFFEHLCQFVRLSGAWHGEARLQRQGGGERIVWLSVNPVRDDKARNSHYVYAFTDITDRKEAEEAQLRAVIEASPEAVLMVDRNGVIIYVNSMVRKLFGYEPASLTGQHVRQLVPASLRRSHDHDMEGFFHKPRARPMGAGRYLRALRQDGSQFSAEISLSPMQTGDAQIVLVTVVDITQRMHDEEALRSSEERWKFALQGAGEGVWDCHLPSGETLFSKRIRELWGGPDSEGAAHVSAWLRRVHPVDRRHVLRELSLYLKGRRASYEVEHRYAGKNGLWRWALVRGMTVAKDGANRALRMIGTFADIGERKAAELELRAAKEAAESALERAHLAERRIVDISEQTQQRIGRELHDDLGQHLTGAAFFARMLHHKLAAGGHAEKAEADQITRLINGAVAKTRALAQGLYPVEVAETGLSSLIEQLARNVEGTFHINCEVVADGDMPALAEGAAINLFRISQEAISNAVKHGGANCIELKVSRLPARLRYEIIDNGRGMDEVAGTRDGLGMHTMRYRAELIGAQLSFVRSDTGGTRVVIDLPVQNEVSNHVL